MNQRSFDSLSSDISSSDKPKIPNGIGPYTKYECFLNEKLVEKAKLELNEKPEWRERDIQALRDMVSTHPGTLLSFP